MINIILFCIIVPLSMWSGYVVGHDNGMKDCKEGIRRMVGRIRPVKHKNIPEESMPPYIKHYNDGFEDAIEEIKFWLV